LLCASFLLSVDFKRRNGGTRARGKGEAIVKRGKGKERRIGRFTNQTPDSALELDFRKGRGRGASPRKRNEELSKGTGVG
jgi:hypothetical protein